MSLADADAALDQLLKGLELRANFPSQLSTHMGQKKISDACPQQIGVEPPQRIHQIGNLRSWKDRAPTHDD